MWILSDRPAIQIWMRHLLNPIEVCVVTIPREGGRDKVMQLDQRSRVRIPPTVLIRVLSDIRNEPCTSDNFPRLWWHLRNTLSVPELTEATVRHVRLTYVQKLDDASI